MNALNYLTFDTNTFNALMTEELQTLYCWPEDFSVFYFDNKNSASYQNALLSSKNHGNNINHALSDIYEDELTILYSFCPFEICGLYAAVSFLAEKGIPLYIAKPSFNCTAQTIINYGDCPPAQIVASIQSAHLLSAIEKQVICENWKEITQNQSNLRIWQSDRIINAEDNYFDVDIQSILQSCHQDNQANTLTNIQLLLRQKYNICLNPAYINWRMQVCSAL